ncbi:hypothetical protein FRC12_010594 [Ceratobasidium sp. 428]|nr:hypothetical protein FRC12_010594 [Ceratobasidium sp. 428]
MRCIHVSPSESRVERQGVKFLREMSICKHPNRINALVLDLPSKQPMSSTLLFVFRKHSVWTGASCSRGRAVVFGSHPGLQSQRSRISNEGYEENTHSFNMSVLFKIHTSFSACAAGAHIKLFDHRPSPHHLIPHPQIEEFFALTRFNPQRVQKRTQPTLRV